MDARHDRFKPVRWWHAALVVLWSVFWGTVGSAVFGNPALGTVLFVLAYVTGIVFLTGLGRWRRSGASRSRPCCRTSFLELRVGAADGGLVFGVLKRHGDGRS